MRLLLRDELLDDLVDVGDAGGLLDLAESRLVRRNLLLLLLNVRLGDRVLLVRRSTARTALAVAPYIPQATQLACVSSGRTLQTQLGQQAAGASSLPAVCCLPATPSKIVYSPLALATLPAIIASRRVWPPGGARRVGR